MREILFKAKRIDNGKWVEGYYCKWLKGERIITYSEKETDCIITWMSNGGMSRYEVDPETICQFTGLHDKHGNKIWENDIVEYHFDNTKKAPIRYGTYQSCFDTKETAHCGFYVDWSEKTYFRKDLGYWINMIEANVVGNIFDNPELLKGGSE